MCRTLCSLQHSTVHILSLPAPLPGREEAEALHLPRGGGEAKTQVRVPRSLFKEDEEPGRRTCWMRNALLSTGSGHHLPSTPAPQRPRLAGRCRKVLPPQLRSENHPLLLALLVSSLGVNLAPLREAQLRAGVRTPAREAREGVSPRAAVLRTEKVAGRVVLGPRTIRRRAPPASSRCLW